VAAERRRPARLDGAHQAELMARQAMRLAVGRAVTPKDIGQLQGWPAHARLLSRFQFAAGMLLPLQLVERTEGVADELRGDAGVVRRGVNAAVAQQRLNDADVRAVFQHVRGEAVAQRVHGDALGDAGAQRGFAAGDLQRRGR